MPAPSAPTKLELIFDCIEKLLGTISHANGYRTSGVLVDRAKDPRAVRQSLPEKYRQFHCALTITMGKRVRDPKVVGGRLRWRQSYTIMVLRTLTKDEDAAGRTLDELVADTQDDIWRAIRDDYLLTQSAAALGITAPQIINHQVDEFATDEGANWPDSHFIARCSFEFDEAPPA